MPRPKVRHAKSLLQTSLNAIARMFVNSADEKNDVEETCTNPVEGEGQSELKCVSNPFEALPSACLVQIVGTLKRRYGWQNKMKHYSLLITPQTRVLDLMCLSVKDKNTAFQLMQLAAAKCPQLTHLLGMNMCTLQGYQSFLPHFKNLQALNAMMDSKNFNDSCMQILGFHCQQLRQLDIRGCDVTDDGIEGLFGQCKSIEELIIYGTNVTRKGVETALRNLPLLKILGHWEIVEALVEMQKNAVPCPKYVLRTLDLFNDKDLPLPLGGLHVAAFLCPFLTKINIVMLAGVTDWELAGLSALESLSNLKIAMHHVLPWYHGTDNDECRITFDGGLAPLLKTRGNSWKKLKLEALPISVRLGVIVKCCPNLKCLSLNCEYSTSTWQEETEANNIFSKQTETQNIVLNQLEKLNVSRFGRRFSAPEPPIKELLLVPTTALKTLAFGNCDSITDNFLHEIYQLNSLKSLKQLEFSKCDSVTKDGIDLFMSEENSLERLGVYECDSVSKEDILDWQERAKNLNWDLEVEDSIDYWSQFD